MKFSKQEDPWNPLEGFNDLPVEDHGCLIFQRLVSRVPCVAIFNLPSLCKVPGICIQRDVARRKFKRRNSAHVSVARAKLAFFNTPSLCARNPVSSVETPPFSFDPRKAFEAVDFINKQTHRFLRDSTRNSWKFQQRIALFRYDYSTNASYSVHNRYSNTLANASAKHGQSNGSF